jgi:hypothetical protein
MEKLSNVLSQNQDLNKSGLLFAPKAKEIMPVLMQGVKEGDNSMMFFDNHDSHIFHAMDYVVMNYHETNSGRITLNMLFDAIKDCAKTYEMAKYCFRNLDKKDNRYTHINCTSDAKGVFAYGILDTDYEHGDNDPYQTAGGYRSWIAKANTPVKYRLNTDLSVTAVFDSNCLVDHYNNNFCGVPTGGGTTKYKLGERVEPRSFTMWKEWNYYEWSKPKFKATVKEIDTDKLKSLCIEYQPDLEFLFNK